MRFWTSSIVNSSWSGAQAPPGALGEQCRQVVARDAGVPGGRRLDGADRDVDAGPGVGVGELRPQLPQAVHPLLDVVPLQPAQPSLVALREGLHLSQPEPDEHRLVDGEAHLVTDQRVEHLGVGPAGADRLGGGRQQPRHPLVEQRQEDGGLALEVPVDPRADDAGRRPDVGHAHRVEAALGDQLGRGAQDPLPPVRVAGTKVGHQGIRSTGTSIRRERRYSPSPLACGSGRVLAATPSPSRPTITTFTARRLGRPKTRTSRSAASGSSSRIRSGVSSATSQPYAASSRTQNPTLALPPLSPDRAPAMVPNGTRTVAPPGLAAGGAAGRTGGTGAHGGCGTVVVVPSERWTTCSTSSAGTSAGQ